MATAALLRDPRAVRLSNQLRGQAAALAQRNITTIPAAYIDEVADQMVAVGWLDLTGIDAVQETATGYATVQRGDEYQAELVEFTRYVWTYNGAPMYAMESPDVGFDKMLPVANTLDGQFTAWMEWIDPPGAPVIIMRRRKTGKLNFMRGITFVGGFLLTAAGLPGIIGEAVLGAELAAAYPAAANAVGTVATRTALTGGDVESAVRSAATGFAGAEFGDLTAQAVDSAAIGAAAGAAVSAALAGGDARAAALQAFLKQGATVSDLFPNDPTFLPTDDDFTPVFDDTGEPTLFYSFDDLGISIDLDSILGNLENPEALTVPADAIIPDDAGTQYTVDGHYFELDGDAYIASLYVDEAANIRAPDNRILVSGEKLLALQDLPDYESRVAAEIKAAIEPLQGVTLPPEAPALTRPANIPPPAGQTKTPTFSWADQADKLLKTAVSIGASIKSIANGTFRPQYATNPYGTARPPMVGVPVRQPDGSTVVNNGNGTSTVRYPDGRVATVPSTYRSGGPAANYGATLIPGVPNTALLIGGGLVVAALLLSRR